MIYKRATLRKSYKGIKECGMTILSATKRGNEILIAKNLIIIDTKLLKASVF